MRHGQVLHVSTSCGLHNVAVSVLRQGQIAESIRPADDRVVARQRALIISRYQQATSQFMGDCPRSNRASCSLLRETVVPGTLSTACLFLPLLPSEALAVSGPILHWDARGAFQ
jgi:hypothetical protein